jgi:hypothetical protein
MSKAMGHDYLAISDGDAQMVWRWGLRHRNGTGWPTETAAQERLFGKSSSSDLSETALDAIAGLVFHAMEQILDHKKITE